MYFGWSSQQLWCPCTVEIIAGTVDCPEDIEELGMNQTLSLSLSTALSLCLFWKLSLMYFLGIIVPESFSSCPIQETQGPILQLFHSKTGWGGRAAHWDYSQEVVGKPTSSREGLLTPELDCEIRCCCTLGKMICLGAGWGSLWLCKVCGDPSLCLVSSVLSWLDYYVALGNHSDPVSSSVTWKGWISVVSPALVILYKVFFS